MEKEFKFKTFKEADEFLRNLKGFFIEGDPSKLTDEEIIMMANDIYDFKKSIEMEE